MAVERERGRERIKERCEETAGEKNVNATFHNLGGKNV